RSLAVVRDALKAIKENAGIEIDYHTWNPVDDEKTQDFIRRGDTIGCFYIESPATRLLLKKLWTTMPQQLKDKADVFEYLVAVSSLVRPASITFVNEFVRRAHGVPYDPLHPLLEQALAETHGIMVYQEDVANVAVALADFTPTEGEHLRKILNKKHKQLQLKDYRERFFRRAMEKEVAPAIVERIWKMIMSFAGYSFCKPHSASYARLSFKCAYLKAHHPAEFMAAVISNEGGFYPTFAYVSEARRMGIDFLPPDINESAWAYTPADKNIRVGFMQVKGLERAWIDKVADERKSSGAFRSLHDFYARTHPGLAALRFLIKAGCFDSIAGGLTRPALLWRAHALAAGKEGDDLPSPRDFSEQQKLKHEIELFGFPLRRRALELYRSPRLNACVPARELARHAGQSIGMAGILVSEKMTQTKKGDLMEFVTFEDLTGIYETTFFPGAYRKYYQLLEGGRPFLLHGRVEEEFGTFTLNVARVERLDMRPGAAILEADSPERPHGFTAAQTRSLGGRLSAAGQNPPRA
ncbi:MAG TPA: DNA polymerase III subunit alpha, partial [Candidatus Binatia bacterium]